VGNNRSNLGVPAGWSHQDRRFGESLKQNLDVLVGQRGDKLDRAVTFRDLLDSGIVVLASGITNFDGNASSIGLTQLVPNLDIPPAPTNLTANGAFQNIIIGFDLKLYQGHSHVELWRNTTDSIATATLSAQISGFTGTYADPVGSGSTFYYWVRAVNQNGIFGPYNSSAGTLGQTAPDVQLLLDTLNGAITESALAQALTSKLDGFESDIDDLETTFASTTAAATSAAAAAASESAAIAAKTAALLAQTGAETAEDDAIIAKTGAETAQSGAQTSATAASNSATGAAGSASSASTSASTAANSANAAGASASAAATSETNASTFATNAGTASTASQTSRLAAEAAESNSATSASAAATSATNANASQTAASQSASTANTERLAAQTARSGAETAETNSASSETNASGSASSASTSATNAANSATAAGNSAGAANTSAQTATTKASDAGTSANAAASSQTAAGTSSTNAANSASAAATSATTAGASETAAGQSASTASTHANTAATKAGEASTFASNAASSASAADGSATAASSTVNGLTARLNNAGGTGVTVEQQFSANASSLGTLEGQYTVKVDANGAVAGFGLANTTTSSGNNTSEFYVNADRFAIMRGGSDTSSAVTPFTVQATATTINGIAVPAGVYMDAAFIKAASITSAQIGSLNADVINAGFIDAAHIQASTIDASKLILDGATMTSQVINGIPTLQVNELNANVFTSGVLNTSRINLDGATITANASGQVQIKDLGVDTLQIKGQAVTIPTSAYSTGVINNTIAQTVTWTSTGAPTFVAASWTQDGSGGSGDYGGTVQIKYGSTVLWTQSYTGQQNARKQQQAVNISFTPSVGSATVTLVGINTDGTYKMSNRSLFALETKK